MLNSYIYRLKCIVRDKQTMFWTLLFPILLGTLFNMAFSKLTSSENFTKIKIAVVENEEFRKNTDFIKAIQSVSASEKAADKNNLFHVSYTSKDDADMLLADNNIQGYIYFDNGLKLVVTKSGIYQSILKSFIDDYLQTSSTVITIISKDSASMNNGTINEALKRSDYLKEVSVGKSAPNTTVNYFYTLIAMACLYGGFWGLKEVTAIQANLSSQGARISISPYSKLKVFATAIFAAITVQLFEIFVLLIYLMLFLKIDFGNQIGYILLTCVVGTVTGVSFGTFIASVIKKSEGIKVAILIGFTMTMSFLSGMMYDNMKYIVATKAPILRYLNPANLITDCFYSLYNYNTHAQYFKDLIILIIFSLTFSIITYLALRRQKYASL